MLTWLRGLALLRHPELVRDLGERRFHLRTVAAIRRQFPSAKLHADVTLIEHDPARLELGDKATVSAGTLLCFGDTTNGFGKITIGENTWIGQYNNLRASENADLRLGANCLVSQFCTLIGTNHAMRRDRAIVEQGADMSRRGVTLEDDVWLGAGVVVVPGVNIGRGAVIGANAVVTHDVPSFEIWGGVPARKIDERN